MGLQLARCWLPASPAIWGGSRVIFLVIFLTQRCFDRKSCIVYPVGLLVCLRLRRESCHLSSLFVPTPSLKHLRKEEMRRRQHVAQLYIQG